MKKIWVSFLFLSIFNLLQLHADEVLTVWAMGEEGIRLKNIVSVFESENPGVQVEVQVIPWSAANEKLTTAIVGNLPPDVSQMGTTWMAKFIAMDAFESLEPFLKNSVLREDEFFKGCWATCLYDENIYGIPWYVDTRVLFYRSDLLKQAGFDGPPKTWDELLDVGRALKALPIDVNKDGAVDAKDEHYALDLPVQDPGALNYAMFVWQNGGSFLSSNATESQILSPKTREALTFYLKLFQEGICGINAAQDVKKELAFESGYYAMFIGGTWMVNNLNKYVPQLAGKWNVALVPGHEEQTSFVGGCNWVVFKASRKKALAFRWIEFMSRPENQVNWFKIADSLPSVREAWQHSYFKDFPMIQVFGKQLEYVKSPPVTQSWEELADLVSQGMEKILFKLGIQPMDEIEQKINPYFEDINRKMNEVLSKSHRVQSLAFKLSIALVIFLSLIGTLMFWFLRRKKIIEGGSLHGVESLLKTSRASLFLFLTPALTVLVVFLFVPVILSFILSLTNWDVKGINNIDHISFIGFENYINLFQKDVFWKSLLNTFIFAFVGVPFTIIVSLIFALILSQNLFKGIAFFRTSLFLPVVTTMVAVAVIWRWFYNPQYGVVNWLLSLFHMPAQDWLGNPSLSLLSLIIMATWKNFGYNMIIFIAGLQGIPQYLYEAADIDGASGLQKFYYVTVPLLKPVTVFVCVITTIGYFQFFSEPYIMTKGGPLNSTISIVLYMYNEAFKYYNLGYASAIAYVLTLIIVGFSLLQISLSRRNPL